MITEVYNENTERKTKKRSIRKGDVYYAELIGFGSQQNGIRPVVIYSNNTNNVFAPTLNVIPITTELKDLSVHVRIKGCGLKLESTALVEQITTINKTQLKNKVGRLSTEYLNLIDDAVDVQFGRKHRNNTERILA